MLIETTLAVLEASSLFLKLKDWLSGKVATGQVDPTLKAALEKLPSNATAADIARIIQPYATGGSVNIKAGSDGGGSAKLKHAHVSGGDGPGGGDLRIAAGDGGPHGKGGDLTIEGGTYKGGDAK
jgi:hypothetical protein